MHTMTIHRDEQHTFTLEPENDTFSLSLRQNVHTLELVTPVATGGGTSDYNDLINKPTINGVELSGDLYFGNISFEDAVLEPLSNAEIDEIISSRS